MGFRPSSEPGEHTYSRPVVREIVRYDDVEIKHDIGMSLSPHRVINTAVQARMIECAEAATAEKAETVGAQATPPAIPEIALPTQRRLALAPGLGGVSVKKRGQRRAA